MRRFFVAAEDIGVRTIEIRDSGDLHHMRRVLRLKPGDEVSISDGERFEYRARIEILEDSTAICAIIDKQAFASEPDTRITLFQGIPKQGKMESIVQKAVELGVGEVIPVFMERTVVVDKGNNMQKKVRRWQKVAAEAVKQSRRGLIPAVREPISMDKAAESLQEFDLILIPYENEEKRSIKEVLRGAHGCDRIALFIGPEGGFSDGEVKRIEAAGGKSVTLGRTTLRTETAGPAAIAMILYELELK